MLGRFGLLVSAVSVLLLISGPIGQAQTFTYNVPERVVETRTEWISGTSVVTKTGIGTVWLIPTGATNDYTGATFVQDGVLRADEGRGLPLVSTLYLNGANVSTRASGVLETRGTFSRNIGTGVGQVYWNGTYGGFAARGGDLIVNLNGGAPLLWGGATNGFNGKSLSMGSLTADGLVDIRNDIGLGAARTIFVELNTNNANNLTALSGVISNGAASAFGLNKYGNGTLWLRNTNTFTGAVTIYGGAIRAVDGIGLPASAPLVFQGTYGLLESSGTFTRTIGTAAGQVSWNTSGSGGGFAAWGGPLTVSLNGGAVIDWSAASGFNGRVLALNSFTANDRVTLQNHLEMGAARTIYVYDNPFSENDFAQITGDIRGNNTGWNLTKSGPGLLELTGFNSYRGNTIVSDGTLRLNGVIASNNYIQVNAPAMLSGTGLVVNAHANGLLSYGAISPQDGSAAGVLRVTGAGTLYTNSRLELVLGPGTNVGRLAISGNVTIQANFFVRFRDFGGRCTPDDQLTILTYGTNCTSFPTNSWSFDASLVRHSARWDWTNAVLVHDPVGKRVYVTGLRVDPPTPDTWVTWNGGVGNWADENWDGPEPIPTRETDAQVLTEDSDITVTGDQQTHTLTLSNGVVTVDTDGSLLSYYANIVGGELNVMGTLKGFDRVQVAPAGTLRVSGVLQGADLAIEGTNVFESGADLRLRIWTNSSDQTLGDNVSVQAGAVSVPPSLFLESGSVLSAGTWTVRGVVDAVANGQAMGLVRIGTDGDMTIRGNSAAGANVILDGGTLRASEATRLGGLDFTLGGVLIREGATETLQLAGPLIVQGVNVDLDAWKMDTAEAVITATNGYWVSTTGDLSAVSARITGPMLRVGGALSVSNVLSLEDVTVTNSITGDAMVIVGEGRTRDQLVWLTGSNSFRGKVQIERGTLRAVPGWGLPDDAGAGFLDFSGDSAGWHATLEGNGLFARNIGQGLRDVYWSGHGGFAARDGDFDVILNDGAQITWSATNGFQGFNLYLNSTSATHVTTIHNPLMVNGTYLLRVFDNPFTNSDYARLTGTIAMDNTARILQKVEQGMVWLTGTNTFAGRLQIDDGVVRAIDGVGLPSAAILYLNGSAQGSRSCGVLESSGTFARNIGTGAGQVYWNAAGGFSAFGGPLQISLNGGAVISWSATAGFRGQNLVSGGQTADEVATLVNPVNLEANRLIYVWDNTNSPVDAFKMAGTIANGGAGNFGIFKYGNGVLWLTGTNTFTGGISNFNGVVRFVDGVGIPATSPMRLSGGNVTPCVFETSGTLTRNLGMGAGEIHWFAGHGGFAAWDGDLELDLHGGADLVWSSLAGGFNGQTLHLGSRTANGRVDLKNNIQLNGNRNIYVWDNPFSTGDLARISGQISNGGTAGSQLLKYGDGLLELTATNAYTGLTSLYDGETRVMGVVSGPVTVAINGTNGPRTTLSGSGRVGTLVVQPNGIVAPGDGGIGTLTVNGNVTFVRGSVLDWEIGPFNQTDRLHVMSNVTFNAEWILRIRDAGGTPKATEKYPVVTFDGFLASNTTVVLDTSLLDPEVWNVEGATVYYDPTNKQVGITGLEYDGPRVEVSDVVVRETDSGEVEAIFTATLLDGFMGDVDLYFATADGTAQAGSDYTATSGMVTLTFDWPTAPIVVKVLGDTVPEWPSEFFLLNLAVTGGNARLVRSAATGTIVDDDGSVQYKMPIVLSGYTGSETLINFPALITLREGDGGFSYGQMGNTNGWDLRFLDADEKEELAYEIDWWDRSGTSYVWVRIPRLSGTNTMIWAVWGDSTVTAPPVYSTNGAVWSEGYLTVHHFNPPVEGIYRDSSPRGFHGVNEACKVSAGAIGFGLDLNGPTNNVNLTGLASTEQSFTFEMWIRTPNLNVNRYLFDALSGRHVVSVNQPTLGALGYYDAAWRYFTTPPLNNGEWHHVVVVTDRDALRTYSYVNGVFMGTNGYAPRALGGQTRIGSQYNAPASYHYDGQMDEFRVSSRARSADWIRATYLTQSQPEVFARKGEMVTARGDSISEAPLAVGNRPASDVLDGKATLNGILIGTGGEETAGLIVCWGTTDGGTGSTGDWAFAASLGTDWGPSAWVSYDVEGLLPGQSYAYRFFATNAVGVAWASPAEWFTVPRGWYVATTGDGSDGQSWATAYTNIQQALDVIQPGDTIFLKGERFNICNHPAFTNQLVVTTANVRIRGGYEGIGNPGANDPATWPTIIMRSAGTNRLMLIDGAHNVEVYGITFSNGMPRATANPVHPDSSGAGLFIRNANGVRIERCVFERNWAYGPFVNGGFVYGGGICAVTSRIEVVSSRFVSNRVTSASTANLQHGSGGAIAIVDGELRLEDSEILDNWVAADYLHGHAYGGGISVVGSFAARRVVIARNEAGEPSADPAQRGDGLYLSGAGRLENALFFRNGQFAPAVSGTSNFAVYVASGYLTMDRCTVTDHKQAGIYRVGGSVVVSNSIFWNNNMVDIYENVAGNVIPFYTLTEQGFYDGVNGCFSANPRFADTNFFHLKSRYGTYMGGWFSGGIWQDQDEDSPAIDAGDPAFFAFMEPFPNGGRVNLGAYGGTEVASKSPAIAVTNEPASAVSPTTARLNGRILSIGGYGTEAWFVWDTEDREDDLEGWANRTFVGTYDMAGPVSVQLTGLIPETVYYYRLMATNAAGGFALATPSESFETVLSRPEVENRGVENESGPAVTLKGEVVLTGGEDPEVYVVWGEFPGGTTIGSWDNVVYAGVQSGQFSVIVTTAPGRTYYYTCYAVNSGDADWAWPPVQFGASNLFYVAADATGEGTGQGWANAFSNLQDALNAVQPGKPAEIYIKGGFGNEIQAATEIVWDRSNVRILGGYEGVGWPGNRDPDAWPSVLTRRPANFIRILSLQGVTNGLLDGVVIRHGNLADFGGGIRIINSTNLLISNCRIERNKGENATGGTTGGGGIFAANSFGTIENCLFERNAVTNTTSSGFALGGGLMISNGQWAVRNSRFIYNTTLASGSGSRARGAGVYVHGGQHSFINCLFSQNYPCGVLDLANWSQGGAAYLTNTVVEFLYVTMAGNVHEGIHGAENATIRNSILWHNGKDLVGTPIVLTHNSISDGDGAGTNGNIVVDPLFEYGFYLGEGSGCRDAASETASAAGLDDRTTRSDGALDDGTADLGYHYPTGIGPWHTLYVASDGHDTNAGTNAAAPLRSLTRALEKAVIGTRIYVAEGTYTKETETFPIVVDQAGIQILGTNADTTIFSALNATSRVFHIFEAPWVVLRGITVADGLHSNYRYYQQGGGLWIRHSSDLLMDSCLITRNLSEGAVNEARYGGGIYAENASFARAVNSRFISNTVAVVAGGWAGLGNGGGLYLLRGSWRFERCVFAGNLGRGFNNEGSRGGAVAIVGGNHEFRNCLIVTNSLESRGYGGDGIYSQDATTRVVNCTVADNGWHPNKPLGFLREGLRQVGSGIFEVRNSIVYGNQTNDLAGFATNALGELVNVHYSCIGDGQNDGVQGCFNADPLFADRVHYHELSRKGYYSGGYWSGGVWLTASETSPCIDAGDPNDPYDLEPEPNGKRINLGAYGNTETASLTARPGGTLIIIR